MLNNFVSVYVPSTHKGNVPQTESEHAAAVNDTVKELAESFGGCTITEGRGAWFSPEFGVIYEAVTICKSYYDKDSAIALKIAEGIASKLKEKFNQEAVSIETESGIEFI